VHWPTLCNFRYNRRVFLAPPGARSSLRTASASRDGKKPFAPAKLCHPERHKWLQELWIHYAFRRIESKDLRCPAQTRLSCPHSFNSASGS
jgi:hypothetical protein